jgi:hypothetical protein
VVELADIFRLHGPDYLDKFSQRMPPSHRRAMQDIIDCRTESLGGQTFFCKKCNELSYSYHSCKNRHCPKCGNDQANIWLEEQKSLLLPTHHFLITFTLPKELRAIARANQRIVYNLLFRASSQALQQLALDPRFVGAPIGMVGVLHTWSRQLIYHPHVHYIVPGGGLSQDRRWLPSKPDFFVHGTPLAILFRAKFRDLLKQTPLFAQVDPKVWRKDWVVDLKAVGSGERAFKYLAPYIFRVAISNRRILKLEDGKVTFSYKDSKTRQFKRCTLDAEEFIRRFLQHVLPPRFVKVRYYGIFSHANRHLLDIARQFLPQTTTACPISHNPVASNSAPVLQCKQCGGPLSYRGLLSPKPRGGLPP